MAISKQKNAERAANAFIKGKAYANLTLDVDLGEHERRYCSHDMVMAVREYDPELEEITIRTRAPTGQHNYDKTLRINVLLEALYECGVLRYRTSYASIDNRPHIRIERVRDAFPVDIPVVADALWEHEIAA